MLMHVQQRQVGKVTDISNFVGGLHQHAIVHVDLRLHCQADRQVLDILGALQVQLVVGAHQATVEQNVVHGFVAADKEYFAQVRLKEDKGAQVFGAVLIARVR